MRRFLILLFVVLSTVGAFAPAIGIYPTQWWTGMTQGTLQLMVHGDGIGKKDFSIDYPGVTLLRTHKVENENYVFLDLHISAAKPGKFKIGISEGKRKGIITYELKQRRQGNGTSFAQGVTSADFMYLIMPDRFANGDVSNDRLTGFKDQTFSRDSMYYRHGGDLKGIENRLDYLQELGVTALWLNPVIENDMPRTSYHGYAFTNHYKIDPRFGGDSAYKSLIDAMHKRGMKMVQDAVYNHVGTEHFTVKDMPMKDWLNQWPAYTQTSYRDQVLFDPHASSADRKRLSDGWFVPSMPDLNHRNPFVANFLIQHALWTVEEFGIDGWRIDTYAYNDLDFMNRCNAALLAEYPKLTIFGETWVHGVPNQSFFTRNNYNIAYKSNQPGVTDFQALWGIIDAATKDFGWNEGVSKLYTTLAQDFVYQDPMQNVVFLDNHDLSRFYSIVGEDKEKYKMSIAWLLTTRGVPQWYYGAEILVTGFAAPDGLVRMDFAGGWPADKVNKFTAAGRTPAEDSIFNYVKTLANFRKTSAAIKEGKLMQFVPEDGVYTYFRYNGDETVMVVMNTAKGSKTFDVTRFEERTKNYKTARNIITSETQNLSGSWSIPATTTLVFQLNR
ncbi:MAG: glycoside hydrolase family 13 protein [Chitinophagaceae bacterium]